MPRQHIKSRTSTTAGPDGVWRVVRNFCAPWHPAIAQMEAENDGHGGLVRRFTVTGDATVYRERLTYFSDSQRRMAYTHLQGIQGVESYTAELRVDADGEGTSVTMSADLDAPAPRDEEVAEGTKAIFDAGTRAIAELASLEKTSTPPRVETATGPLQKLTVDGAPNLALSVAGEPSDVLCLFLHGIGGNRSNWDAQLAAVAPHCCAAALDLRGYGESDLGEAQSTIEDYCDDILRILEKTGSEKLILCGLSYGAWIATSFAMRHPEKMQALALAGGCTGMSEAGADERDAFRQSREVPLLEGKTPADFAPAVLDVIAGPGASDAIRQELYAAMAAIPARTYADALRCFTNPTEKFDFARLNLPVLMMTGEHDRLAPPQEIGGVAHRIWTSANRPDVRFEIIAGAGHVCNLEKPETFNQILVEFIDRVLA